jgi:hypothetical protein
MIHDLGNYYFTVDILNQLRDAVTLSVYNESGDSYFQIRHFKVALSILIITTMNLATRE